MNIDELVTRYLATWNETDQETRRDAIDELWSADGVYTDPLVVAAGRDQIDATIGAVQSQFPGLAITLAGQTAVVVEPYGYTVTLIDTKTGHVYPPITVGSFPVAAAVTG